MNPVAFDLDHTLFHSDGDASMWTNPVALERHCLPYKGARDAVQRAFNLRGVVFITGRSEVVRRVTFDQIRLHMGIYRPNVIMQRAWNGWDALRDHKVLGIQQTRACCLVGDSEVDRTAANLAGVPYRTPEEVGIDRSLIWDLEGKTWV